MNSPAQKPRDDDGPRGAPRTIRATIVGSNRGGGSPPPSGSALTPYSDPERRNLYIKFLADGLYQTKDGGRVPSQAFAKGFGKELKHWSGGRPIEFLEQRDGEELPDVNELNARIPVDEWEPGLDGDPRPPWDLQSVVHFINPANGAEYTFASSAKGAAIAISDLRQAVSYMSAVQHKILQGAVAIPMVKLGSVPFKTKFGMRKRPDFYPVSWWWFRPSAEAGGTPTLERLPPLSFGDELDDKNPF